MAPCFSSPAAGQHFPFPLPLPPADLLDGASLFLDFDGTLVDIAARPDAVRVDAGLVDLLKGLDRRLHGRIALVSGRSADTIAALLDYPDITIAGSHGMEIRFRDGRVIAPPRPAALNDVTHALHDFSATRPGLVIEEKPLGVGLHYRSAPELAMQSRVLAERLARESGLHLQTGKMVYELRVGGGDKGRALRLLMAEPDMRGTRPVFLGDDDTDEPAFVAAAALLGNGILVGPQRSTAAHYRLDDVAAVREWLERELTG